MAEYAPDYLKVPPLTVEHLDARVEELRPILVYAREHDDVLALDELFCRIVTLEHRIILWERAHEQRAHVARSRKELDRALKWAWLAREEEDHAGGMYGGKLGEAIEVLQELRVFLHSIREMTIVPAESGGEGMSREEADSLATTIKERLPQAEVEVRAGDQPGVWVVEARNPRRGTSQVFLSTEQFEQLMQAMRR